MSSGTSAIPTDAMRESDARISMNGTRYFRAGSGSSVVLIHGVGLDATIWQAQFDALTKHFDVIAYDMLGHGGSTAPLPDASLDDYVEQFTQLMDELVITKCAVVGFSMGGLVARKAAIDAPSLINRMVILASVFSRSEKQSASIRQRVAEARQTGPGANIDAAIARWFSARYVEKHPQQVARIRSLVLKMDPDCYCISYSLFAQSDNAGRDQLSTIHIPVLVATGAKDVGSTPEMAKALAQKLPNATCTILPEMKHMLIMEHPEAVNTLLRNFLNPSNA